MSPQQALDRVVKPVAVTQPFPGIFVVDYGSNLAGLSKLKSIPTAPAGTTIVLHHAEILQHEHLPDLKGDINTSMPYYGNLRSAKATDTYIMAGGGKDKEYMPTKTYHGGGLFSGTCLSFLSAFDL